MAEVSFDIVHALLSSIYAMEEDTTTDKALHALRDDSDWLQLPPKKRAHALLRYRVLRGYDRKQAPTKVEASAAAARMGVRLRSFYALLRDWRNKEKSIFALVPYRPDETQARPSRLDAAVADELRKQVKALLQKDPLKAPAAVVKAITKAWPNGLAQPSAVTVRAFYERAKEARRPEPGSLHFETKLFNDDGMETASRLGEVLVIDHTAPARILLLGETATVPTFTLAIDLFTGLPIGAALSEGAPSPEGVLDALADAHGRMRVLGQDSSIQPRIVYASTMAPEWTLLREQLQTQGLELVEQQDHRIYSGGFTRRLLGNKLGSIALQPTKVNQAGVKEMDIDQDSLLTMNQTRFVLDRVIDTLLNQRLAEANGGAGTLLCLPQDIIARGTLKSRTRPLIEMTPGSRPPSNRSPGENHRNVNSRRDEVEKAFIGEINDLVADAIGDLAMHIEIEKPTAQSPGWLVLVETRHNHQIPDVWLRLAQLAIRIFATEKEKVRFNVSFTDPGGAGEI